MGNNKNNIHNNILPVLYNCLDYFDALMHKSILLWEERSILSDIGEGRYESNIQQNVNMRRDGDWRKKRMNMYTYTNKK